MEIFDAIQNFLTNISLWFEYIAAQLPRAIEAFLSYFGV